MNLLLFAQNELQEGRLHLTDQRAEHIIHVLRARVGDTIRVGLIDGEIGQGRILSMTGSSVELLVCLDQPPPSKSGVELVLALPRPIMLQRILKQATVLGVSAFHLLRSARVEKSYFQSPVLHREKLHGLLLTSLSQAVDTVVPAVTIHTRFRPFVEDILPGLGGRRLLAHPDAGATLARIWEQPQEGEHLLLAIGPEGGWSDFEVDLFVRAGFVPFSMGPRILHVDTAVVTLLGQLQLLADPAGR